jgi:hypothetical protein
MGLYQQHRHQLVSFSPGHKAAVHAEDRGDKSSHIPLFTAATDKQQARRKARTRERERESGFFVTDGRRLWTWNIASSQGAKEEDRSLAVQAVSQGD